ncbi:S1 family peptidase [Shewanella ulleungensis]|uniref:S1 family peptidase n=1 Tax=Shewanella ulleungensis TaxID=2282699 RepID=UPI003D7988C2
MNSKEAQALFVKYSNSVAYVEVEKSNGDLGIGTCFHVGEGIFITAKHVVENVKILDVKLTEPVAISTEEYFRDVLKSDVTDEYIAEYNKTVGDVLKATPKFKYHLNSLSISEGPFFHKDERVDLAAFKVESIHNSAGIAKLGIHYDDWVLRDVWNLSEAIILGYPPIPMVNEPVLVSSKAEIHTFVFPRHSPQLHFLLSATPRGGFSGGVAIHENGAVLGVITSSLVENNLPEQNGFFAVLSIEPIIKFLEDFNIMPKIQKQYQNEQLGFEMNEL